MSKATYCSDQQILWYVPQQQLIIHWILTNCNSYQWCCHNVNVKMKNCQNNHHYYICSTDVLLSKAMENISRGQASLVTHSL